MRFEGTVEIAAPRERVWAFVTDPRQVGGCAPGVESVDVTDDTHFTATGRVGFGFLSARVTVTLELTELDPPNRAVIRAHGQAPGGGADATAGLRLSDGTLPGTTVMDWVADIELHGYLASAGTSLIEGTAQRVIDDAFGCIRSKLET
jgi:uncharacterized protein